MVVWDDGDNRRLGRSRRFPVAETRVVLGYRPLKPVIEAHIASVRFHHLGQEGF